MSAEGSDRNDCHAEKTACRSLKTVLDQVLPGAIVNILSSDIDVGCWSQNMISYTIRKMTDQSKVICGKLKVVQADN